MADSNYRDETKQQLADATEVFALFDRDCDGLVETTRLDVLCRALGGTPPSASDWPRMHELKRPEFTNVGADGVGSVTLDDFLFVLKFKAKDAMTPQAILELFGDVPAMLWAAGLKERTRVWVLAKRFFGLLLGYFLLLFVVERMLHGLLVLLRMAFRAAAGGTEPESASESASSFVFCVSLGI